MKNDILVVRLGARERRLLDETQKILKMTRSAIVREAIVRYATQAERESKMTVGERLAPYFGKYDSGGKNLSARTGEKFTDLLIERERAKRRSR